MASSCHRVWVLLIILVYYAQTCPFHGHGDHQHTHDDDMDDDNPFPNVRKHMQDVDRLDSITRKSLSPLHHQRSISPGQGHLLHIDDGGISPSLSRLQNPRILSVPKIQEESTEKSVVVSRRNRRLGRRYPRRLHRRLSGSTTERGSVLNVIVFIVSFVHKDL